MPISGWPRLLRSHIPGPSGERIKAHPKLGLTMTSCVSPGRGRPAARIENDETGLADHLLVGRCGLNNEVRRRWSPSVLQPPIDSSTMARASSVAEIGVFAQAMHHLGVRETGRKARPRPAESACEGEACRYEGAPSRTRQERINRAEQSRRWEHARPGHSRTVGFRVLVGANRLGEPRTPSSARPSARGLGHALRIRA